MENDDVFVPKIVSSVSSGPSTSSSSDVIIPEPTVPEPNVPESIVPDPIAPDVNARDGYSTPPDRRIPASPEPFSYINMLADNVSNISLFHRCNPAF